MRLNHKRLLPLVCLLVIAGCAATSDSYRFSVEQAVLGDGWITVNRSNGRVELYGTVEDKVSEAAVLRAAWAGEGVTEVINHIYIDFD